jgi:predicted TIM-barrel fold metal-dependent hydrolase
MAFAMESIPFRPGPENEHDAFNSIPPGFKRCTMSARRNFLSALPAMAIAAGLKAAEKVSVIDTHLHCFAGRADARFPYHKDAPYRPDAAATPEHLLKCMADAGVDRAVVVHPEPYQDDHRYLEHCLAVGKDKLKGTCLFFTERDDSPKRLRELAKRVPLVAARIHAYNPDRLPEFEKPEFSAFWNTVGDLGMAIQLHFEPRHAAGFTKSIADHPGIPVLVDHLGRPFQGTEKEFATVLGWSKYRNVTVKLSSVPDRGKYPHRDPGKAIRQLANAFGAERMMYGGGFEASATGTSYRAERERIAGFLTHLTVAERGMIFGGNAAKRFKFA